MQKEAVTDRDIIPLLKKRWSPRAFEDRPVENDKLLNILEAARWSPSASNLQPWVFFAGLKSDNTYDKIFSILNEFNQLWAGNAPVLILNCARTTSTDGNTSATWQYDLGQAVAHLSIQAMAEDIYTHQMGGFDRQKAVEIFKLPENYRAVSVTALGYIGDPKMLHPRMQKSEVAPRERKEINTFVFADVFGETPGLIG